MMLKKMIEIICKETIYTYNAYHITKAFFPDAEISQRVDSEQEPPVRIVFDGGSCFSVAMHTPKTSSGRFLVAGDVDEMDDGRQNRKMQVTRQIYDYLSELTGRKLAWGMLTGVRPTKLAMQKLENQIDAKEIVRILKEEYCVTEEKAELAIQIARREKELLGKLHPNGYSLYVGIPFCPSICSYCSFSSSPVDLWKERVDDYLDALCKEIKAIAEMAAGKRLDTVYIGGGTPTSLTPEQLDRLLETIAETFSFAHVQEYTIEAGRPDSITREKLEVIRRFPVTRISVNPQTMQQKTLDLVGRRHTVQDVKDIFHMARKLGFDNINMDLIAGLPGETAEDMQDTLRQIEELQPDSLTVHSLAIKRAARMGQEAKCRRTDGKATEEVEAADAGTVSLHTEITQMVEVSAKSAKRMGLLPYYLYRQKNIAGNFENVGYAKVDKAGIYNILIMEEKQTILAAGAGSISKRVYPDGHIERCENVKDVTQYIERIGEMIERKRVLLED